MFIDSGERFPPLRVGGLSYTTSQFITQLNHLFLFLIMDGVAAVAWAAALHCYGDSNDGDNNDAGDDSNGRDRDGDNTQRYAHDKRDAGAEAGADEVAVPPDVAVTVDAVVAGQMQ